ncbi:MAG: substrate-binding periplasmic protein [Desulfovibrionaceae bacterium]
MKRIALHSAVLYLALLVPMLALCGPIHASGNVVTMASLEWPPYTGARLKGQGASVVVARMAFAAMGYELRVLFFPWKRAVTLARMDTTVAGYFPEYFNVNAADSFLFSNPIGTSPLGFAERASAPVEWQTVHDLGGIPIGTVAGYANTDLFDTMAAQGKLAVEPVSDDAINLEKLAKGRIRLAVMDCQVLRYMTMSRRKDSKENSIQCNARLLGDRTLHLCFRKDEAGKRILKIFNEGLRHIDVESLQEYSMRAIFNSLLQDKTRK